MSNIAKAVSFIALLATIVPSCLYLTGSMALDTVKSIAISATIAWFLSTPFWMGKEPRIDDTEVEI